MRYCEEIRHLYQVTILKADLLKHIYSETFWGRRVLVSLIRLLNSTFLIQLLKITSYLSLEKSYFLTTLNWIVIYAVMRKYLPSSFKKIRDKSDTSLIITSDLHLLKIIKTFNENQNTKGGGNSQRQRFILL